MSLKIRQATADDCYIIAEIIKDSMGYENSPDVIRYNLDRISALKSDIVLIAEYLSYPVGFIHAEDYNSLYYPPQKELMSIAVRKAYQNMKIGSAMMTELEKWAQDTGRKGIRILSSLKFSSAHKFYQKLGYVSDKTQLNLYKFF